MSRFTNLLAAALIALSPMATQAYAADNAMIAQAAPPPAAPAADAGMSPEKNIVDNAASSKIFTVLTGTLKAADLTAPLSGPGPFTVFAPTDMAFLGLPDGTVQALLKPESKPMLRALLAYHVVPGTYTAADIARLASAGGGKASLKTLEGETLPLSKSASGGWQITDSQGNTAQIVSADIKQSNGIMHAIDKVLMPNK